MQAVQSPIIPVVAELIRRHPGTISLGQGVAYYGPPGQVIAALSRAFDDPAMHKYHAVDGIPPLVEKLSAKLLAENGIETGDEAGRIVVTAGGNMAFMNAVLAVTDPGDEVVLQAPYYFNHEMAVTIAGCKPVIVGTDERYQLRPEAIDAAITPRTRAVVTVSPNNPTGAVYPEDSLRRVNEICRRRGVFHVHDEAYEYFTYGAGHFSPGSIDGAAAHTISLFSLSKSYGFASWRIGYMVIPDDLLTAVKKIQDTILICPPVVSQYAAIGALEAGSEYCRGKLAALEDVRYIALEAFGRLQGRVDVPRADGAFYFLLRVHDPRPPMELVERLVREYGVAVIPGTTFGMNDGCYLRVAYGALQKDTAAEGIGRLVRGLDAILR